MTRLSCCAALLAALGLLAGCSPKPQWGGPVSGAVTFDGKPLGSGAVTFVGPTGHARNAEIADGKYHIAEPPYGPCQITVMTAPEVDEMGKAKAGGKYVELPARYGNPKESGLTFNVTDQPQTHDIKLTR